MGEVELREELREFDGFSPTGQGRRLSRVPLRKLLEHHKDTGNQSKYEEAWLIPDVCTSPSGIWQNLGRSGQEEAFCYAGKASGEFGQSHGASVDCPPGFVFMVFLTKA